jgi:branched-chain amino acid transport system ATP-binding protein
MSADLLRIEGLNAFYGAAQILFDLSLRVGQGEVVALMGRNGAGKSTTMKAIMGLLKGTSGRVWFMGQDISASPPFVIARLGLGWVPEDRRIFTDLSVRENLDIGRQPARVWPDQSESPVWSEARIAELFPNLGQMMDRRGGQMSGGEQQMLTVARTLMGNPFMVMLDEPSEGVAPVIVEQMASTIVELKRAGVSVLLSEQNLHFAELVSDRVYVLEKGQIRFAGSMDELKQDEAATRSYLTV